jgi:putative ABC transport system permease protein
MPPSVLVVGIEAGHEKAFLGNLEADSGSNAFTGPDQVILGQSAATYYQGESNGPIGVGATIQIQGHSLEVIGILKSAPQIFNNAVLLPLDTAQRIFDRPGTVSSVILTAAQVDQLPQIKADISSRYPELTVSTQDDLQQSAQVLLDGVAKFFSVITNSIVVVAILIVTIVVVMAVMEQRKDIGVLRAVGAGKLGIFGMVVGESLLLSLLGALLALPIAFFLVKWGMSEFKDLSGILTIWMQTILVAMAVGFLAALLPAWQAMRVDPLEALRYE